MTADLSRSRRKPQNNGAVDRLPPASPECEQALLGCCLLSPQTVIPEAQARIPTSEVFYDLRCRTIWETLVDMSNDGVGIDVITLQARLKAFGQLEEVGGGAFLSGLPDAVPSAANAGYYLNNIIEKYQLRRMIQVATEVISKAYEHEGEVAEILDWFESEALKVRVTESKSVTKNCGEAVRRAVSTIENYHERRGVITGLSTGLPDFDKMVNGFVPGDLIVIAGRPSTGKSSIAMNIAEHVAIEQGVPVGVYSFEMSEDSLVLRMLCSRARVNLRNIQQGFMAERDFPKITTASSKLYKAPIYINDCPSMTITQIRADARRMWHQLGIRLFIIDYFQRIKLVLAKGETRQSAFADAVGGVKSMARELKVPVVLLSQISRQFEKDGNRKPQLSDMKETGALEEDADIAGLLYRCKLGDDDDPHADAIPVNLLIGKSRNGPTGDVHLTFLRSITRFESATKISGDDVPETQESMNYGTP